MHASRYPYARSAGRYVLLALLLVVGMTAQFAFGGLDRGTFDFMQSASPDPLAWAWVPDSTSDGAGVEYLAYLPGFQHAGPGAPSVTTTVNFQAGGGHEDLEDFLAWIVANHAHVQSAAELTIVRRDVTLISLP